MNMKRIIAMLLAAVVCMSLAACGGERAGNAIVGEWKSADGDVIIFNEDGTGGWSKDIFEWSYDKAHDRYSMLVMGMTVTFEIETKDGIRALSKLGMLSPYTYYHIDDYEKAVGGNQ